MESTSLPSTLLEGFSFYDNFILVGHEQPDADCLCSQIGMGALLRKMGKQVRLLAEKPFSRPETLSLEPLFESSAAPVSGDEKTAVILLDLSDTKRTGIGEKLAGLPLFVVDHHASGQARGPRCYVDPKSPSTTLLVRRLWEAAGYEPDEETCRHLFFGFATDTGFFRHMEAGSGGALREAAALVDGGASPKETFARISAGRELGTRRLMGRILERSRLYCDGRILISWEEARDREELQTDERDSDKLYQLLQSVRGCEAAALIRMDRENHCLVGLRSNDRLDVGRIASALGGGGHQKAAGCSAAGSIEQVRDDLIARFAEQLALL